ncbi:MAG: alpha/beta hydrolase, partial [Actinomycetota bacterium]
ENDPWVGIGTARRWAREWGADFTSIGEAGHINVDSGYGPWPQGLAFFEEVRQRVRAGG